jgi:hypothetical protein
MTRLCAIAIIAALVGCADNGDEALLILQNQFPQEECIISGDEDSVVQDDGTLDVVGGSGYLFTPLVKNTAVGATGTEAQRRLFIKSARVDISFADVSLFSEAELQQYEDVGLTRFEVPLAGSVSPDGGTLALSFDIIQSALTRVLSDKIAGDAELLVLADIRVRGTLGGSTVESQKFRFAVRVCANCLVASVGTCEQFRESGAEALPGNPCNPFQDSPVDCCLQGNVNFCPAR